MEVSTRQAIWMWTELAPIDRAFVNAGFVKNNNEVDLKDAGCTLRINTCLNVKDFPMKEKLESLIKRYEDERA